MPRALFLPEEVRLSPLHPLLGRAVTWFLAGERPVQIYHRPAYDAPGTREAIAAAQRSPRLTSLRGGPLQLAIPEKWLKLVEHYALTTAQGAFDDIFDSLFRKGNNAQTSSDSPGGSR